jgi:hypothetical protein
MQPKNHIENPTQTFFFERPDGTRFSCSEKEAWNIHCRRNQILGERIDHPKLVGTSDGRAYHQAVIEAVALENEGKREEAQARLRLGEEEEFAVAKGNIIQPRDMDRMGSGSYLV